MRFWEKLVEGSFSQNQNQKLKRRGPKPHAPTAGGLRSAHPSRQKPTSSTILASSPTASSPKSSPASPSRTPRAPPPSPDGGAPSGAPPRSTSTTLLPRWAWECISKILSEHRGPARRLCLRNIVRQDSIADLAAWLRSPALDNLVVIHVDYRYDLLLPPFALLRFRPTLRFANFGGCRFPEDLGPALAFPHLNRLILTDVGVSKDALHGLLSACTALSLLLLDRCSGFDRVVISSPALRHFGMCADGYVGELVIEYAPRLERLIAFDHLDIRVIRAPRLQTVGMLDSDKTALHCGTMASRGISGGSLAMLMCSVKLLILDTFGPDLDAVLDFIKCFPCLKKIYITSYQEVDLNKKNVLRLNPQDCIRCLDLSLREVVMKGYEGKPSDIYPAVDPLDSTSTMLQPRIVGNEHYETAQRVKESFSFLNAKVLEVMEISVQDTDTVNNKWKADQRRRLRLRLLGF